jgi:hypothetical protein
VIDPSQIASFGAGSGFAYVTVAFQ